MTNTFQTMLREIMERNGLNQRQLAKKAKINSVTLSRALRDDYLYKPTSIAPKLIHAVGATVKERIELFRLAGVIPPEIVDAYTKSFIAAQAIYTEAMRFNFKTQKRTENK